MRSSDFTFVELLIVVALLAIVAIMAMVGVIHQPTPAPIVGSFGNATVRWHADGGWVTRAQIDPLAVNLNGRTEFVIPSGARVIVVGDLTVVMDQDHH